MIHVLKILIAVVLFSFFPAEGWGDKSESSSISLSFKGAHIIDDFKASGINRAKWKVVNDKGGPDLFSQSGGRLNFSVTAGAGTLQSVGSFGAGFYTMQFFNYSSTNNEESGSQRGAFVGLCLGPKDNFVRIIRCQNGRRSFRRGETPYVGVFEANYIDNAKGGIQVFYEMTQVTSGRLGLYYDGSKITFYFNRDPYSEKGWQTMKSGGKVLQWSPHWNEPPELFIRGFDPSGRTSFQVSNLEYRPAPPEAD